MTPDERFAAFVEGHFKGTIFRVLEIRCLTWKQVRKMSLTDFWNLLMRPAL